MDDLVDSRFSHYSYPTLFEVVSRDYFGVVRKADSIDDRFASKFVTDDEKTSNHPFTVLVQKK